MQEENEKILQFRKVETFENTPFKCKIEKDITKNDSIRLKITYDDSVGGREISYKFKDPRDTMKFLLKNWRIISPIESIHLFDHIELGFAKGIYSPLEIYYMLLLEQQIYFNLQYALGNHLPDIYYDRNMCLSTKLEVLDYLKTFEEELNENTRAAHIFAVKNTWLFWNIHKNNKTILTYGEEDENIFDTKYKNKEVDYVFSFNLYHRLWRVYFKDKSWIIAFDIGNGWYEPLTDFNDYKIIKTLDRK